MALREVVSTFAHLPTLLRVKKTLEPKPLNTPDSLAIRMEKVVERFGSRPAVIFEGTTLTWNEVNERSNRYAHALKHLDITRGDTVSVVMENRIEFICLLVALHKIGAVASLINTNLTGNSLVHCLGITGSKTCVFGEERLSTINDVRATARENGVERYLFVTDLGQSTCPDWSDDLDVLAQEQSSANPPDTGDTTIGETALNIFTSGTTGLPKAAVVSHRRLLASAAGSYLGGLRCTEKDCIYLCLPLYHGTGLFLGVGASLSTGACLFIRRKFSGSNFLKEARENNTTCFIYIGELCRYLLNTPEAADDHRNPITRVMGNGLRPDVWHQFKRRFGIERVAEFYGASEGNVGFVNLLNRDCTVGTTTIPIEIVSYDVENDEMVRGADGRLIRVEQGEPGLLLAKITEDNKFDGYTSEAETEKKIIRDAFEDGDAWFNTGDLMRTIDVGFSLGLPHFQFVDRVGDTYRWKSENVSTNEVGEVINDHPQVRFCNVYGVDIPGADGKAGMAAIVLGDGESALDLESFSAHVRSQLPSYARPVFIRVQSDIDTTGTFKMVKGQLRKEGYDIEAVQDPLYVLKPGTETYTPLDPSFVAEIRAGRGGY
ncbi:MAG: long-chain-acyl-CoA synthetase [Halioglobus sp.]|nr:long-chain-acyl-CoA synthetase [Halioglobus sp.]